MDTNNVIPFRRPTPPAFITPPDTVDEYDYLTEALLIADGDVVADPDIEHLVALHRALALSASLIEEMLEGGCNLCGCWDVQEVHAPSAVEGDEGGFTVACCAHCGVPLDEEEEGES